MVNRNGWGGRRINAGRQAGERTTVVRLPIDIAEEARRFAARRGGISNVEDLRQVEVRTRVAVPHATVPVSCGFPSPAEDYLDPPLDYNEYLGAGRPNVFSLTLKGESMTGAGYMPGDKIVVEKGADCYHGDVVVACLDGEFVCKTFWHQRGRVVLHPENPAFHDIDVTDRPDFWLWGLVIGVVRKARRGKAWP